jgi:acetyl-CoA C-acetyltransferase
MSVHVASVGVGRFGKRPEGLVELAAEAVDLALEGIGRRPIDLLVVGSMLAHGPQGPDALLPHLAGRIGVESASGFRVEAASATGAMAFHAAALALAGGPFDRALVVAVEKMTDRPTPVLTGELAAALHPAEVAAGATMPGLAALVAQRYLARHGLPTSICDPPSVHARAMAVENPNAQFRTAVTVAEVASSRPVALPLRLLHCAAITDGAAAVVLERGGGPATVLGLGQGFDALRTTDRADLTGFAATRVATARAYEAARITRKEVDVIELHDAFSPFAPVHLEDLGVCGPGEGPQWYERGWVARDGRLPVNPSGGLLGRGHPVAATGLVAIAEVARQLRGEAADMAVARRPRIGLAQTLGGLGPHNFVTVLGERGP